MPREHEGTFLLSQYVGKKYDMTERIWTIDGYSSPPKEDSMRGLLAVLRDRCVKKPSDSYAAQTLKDVCQAALLEAEKQKQKHGRNGNSRSSPPGKGTLVAAIIDASITLRDLSIFGHATKFTNTKMPTETLQRISDWIVEGKFTEIRER